MSGFVVDDPVGTAERAFMCAGTPEPQMAMVSLFAIKCYLRL
eukprot:SAG31_NODE_2797_length_5081_cov_11.092935_10_plen_42_part_00